VNPFVGEGGMGMSTSASVDRATTSGNVGAAVTVTRIARVLVYLVYGLAVASLVILLIAFFLKLFSASESAPFVQWIYRSTDRIMQPFRGIFPSVEGESGSVLDVSLLFAMLMYGLLAMGVHALIEWINGKISTLLVKASRSDTPSPDLRQSA